MCAVASVNAYGTHVCVCARAAACACVVWLSGCPGFADGVYPSSGWGWRFSTNPASSWGAPYPNHSVSHASCYYITEGGDKGKTGRLFAMRALADRNTPRQFRANALPTPKHHASADSHHPSLIVSSLLSFTLVPSASLPPFLPRFPPIPPQHCTADVSSQEALCTSECYK